MKRWMPLIAPGVTFGPLFMTRICGKAAPETDAWMMPLGTFMLAAALTMLAIMVRRQGAEIETLRTNSSNSRLSADTR